MNAEATSTGTSTAKRFAVRAAACFFGLYFFPFPLDLIPGTARWWGWWSAGWKAIVIWTGAHVLRLPHPIVYERTGSGDTVHDYVFVLVLVVLSALVGLIWTALDRKRKDGARLGDWLRVYLRYALATVMFGYGFNKIFDLQFSPPGNLQLTQPLGQMTPMMLAWTFMGYSVPYTVFAGALECLGGLLLLFRRTATLGAMASAIVLTNVVMMNFCYDIPVKLHSSLYLAMAIVILSPVMRRMADFFIFHRPAEAEDTGPPRWGGWKRPARWIAKALLVGLIVVPDAYANWKDWRTYGRPSVAAPGSVEGFFEIEKMTKNGVEVPRLYTDDQGWRWVDISWSFLRIGMVDGTRLASSRFSLDASAHTLNLTGWTGPLRPGQGPAPKGLLTFAWTDPKHLHLQGTLDGASVSMDLEKREPSDSKLMGRGFHWISEHPYTQ